MSFMALAPALGGGVGCNEELGSWSLDISKVLGALSGESGRAKAGEEMSAAGSSLSVSASSSWVSAAAAAEGSLSVPQKKRRSQSSERAKGCFCTSSLSPETQAHSLPQFTHQCSGEHSAHNASGVPKLVEMLNAQPYGPRVRPPPY